MKNLVFLITLLLLIGSCGPKEDYLQKFHEALELTDKEEYEKAIDELNHVIDLAPEFDSAYVERAYVYMILGNLDEALIDVKKSGQTKPL